MTRYLKTCIALHVIRPPDCDPREDVLLCSGEVSRPKRTHFQACLLHVFSGMCNTTSCVASAFAYEASGVLNQEATPLQNAFGLTFTIFSAWYFLRVVRKRGNAAKKFRVANSLSVSKKMSCVATSTVFLLALTTCQYVFLQKEERERRDLEELKRVKKLNAQQSFVGGITAIGISIVLYEFAQNIQASFDSRPVPVSYQIRQISNTVRTIVEGLAYLATFIYAANGTGLVALSMQKLLDTAVPRDTTKIDGENRRRTDTNLHHIEDGTDGE